MILARRKEERRLLEEARAEVAARAAGGGRGRGGSVSCVYGMIDDLGVGVLCLVRLAPSHHHYLLTHTPTLHNQRALQRRRSPLWGA